MGVAAACAHARNLILRAVSLRLHIGEFLFKNDQLRRSFDRPRAMTKQAIAGFERSYLASFEDRYDKPALFAAATLLFELRCTAVLLTMQKGKVDLTRQRMPIARDQSLGNRLANRFTVPLLEMGKRWLFLQLVRELP